MNIFVELIRAFSPEQSGFAFMWILALMALSALGLIIERWLDIRKRTNVDTESFIDHLKVLIKDKRLDEAYNLCHAAERRVLPRIVGAGIKRKGQPSVVILSAMEEESLHLIPVLEKRINYILMFGNISTLLGLMGTIFGLILSFAAVARPDVDPVEKSSLLAAGISTAMNTTLLGLMISVPCVLIFSLFKSKVDNTVQDIDRYAASLLKVLLPTESVRKEYRVSGRRIKQEVDTEPNIAPMMNLMVILIPLLLSSAEFVKIGAIELKLPESSGAGGGGGGGPSEEKKDVKLDLGIVITKRGFDLFHYFKGPEKGKEPKQAEAADTPKPVAIPMKNGEYDFVGLNAALADVKKKALFEVVRAANPAAPQGSTLQQLYNHYTKNDYSAIETFKDHESIKIVAEEQIKYETVVSVMDAARGTKTPHGNVSMFPNVSLAGGIIY